MKFVKFFNNSRGAISLFVLIACMFFLIVLMGIYIFNMNKVQAQNSQIQHIQDTYKVSLSEMDEQYSNISNSSSSNITMEQILDLVYPVGSIYISEKNTFPGTLFGGTWVQIKDTFLLSAGDTYSAGSSGGEASHTLTIAEMPTHDHRISQNSPTTSSNAYTFTTFNAIISSWYKENDGLDRKSWHATTAMSGNSQAHNNMPPYYTVYMWKRTN